MAVVVKTPTLSVGESQGLFLIRMIVIPVTNKLVTILATLHCSVSAGTGLRSGGYEIASLVCSSCLIVSGEIF